MATEKEMHELIGHAVVDRDFRVKLLADPAGVARDSGYDLTPEQITTLKAGDGGGIAEVLEERLPKSAGIGCATCLLTGADLGAY